MLTVTVLLMLAADEYKKVDEVDGVTVESRAVPGSSFAELRFSTTTSKSVDALCTEAFGTGKYDATEPDLKSREILSESADERTTYERMTPAVVSPRSYALHLKRSRVAGVCQIDFEAANDAAPPPEPGWVRVTRVWGSWRAEPLDGGKSRLTYVIFTDPAGAIPALFVEGARRKLGVTWVKRVVERAAKQ
jgi:hypothetical protein